MAAADARIRLATAWLGGCSGCHMSFLDLDERLVELAGAVEVVFGPLMDDKEVPERIDVALVEGAVANLDHLELATRLRECSAVLVSFGDCAVTGNVTALRNTIPVDDLLTKVYREGPGAVPVQQVGEPVVPMLLPKVVPLHQVVPVDVYLPGCPPDPEAIWEALTALVFDRPPVSLSKPSHRFG